MRFGGGGGGGPAAPPPPPPPPPPRPPSAPLHHPHVSYPVQLSHFLPCTTLAFAALPPPHPTQALLAAGAEPSLPDATGTTARQAAQQSGDPEIIQLLGGAAPAPGAEMAVPTAGARAPAAEMAAAAAAGAPAAEMAAAPIGP